MSHHDQFSEDHEREHMTVSEWWSRYPQPYPSTIRRRSTWPWWLALIALAVGVLIYGAAKGLL